MSAVGGASANLREVQELIVAGRRADAKALLDKRLAGFPEPDLLARAAALYTQMAAHPEALFCQQALHRRYPAHPQILRALAAAETACGLLAEAEGHMDAAIAADPTDADDWYNRSVLRRQSEDRNHIVALRLRLAQARNGDVAPLAYALAKELEDLGEHAESFTWLRRGADARRARLSYRVDSDVDAMTAIARAFPDEKLLRSAAGASEARPIFIVGLPRTGTTLLEQMLGMHSEVAALGELTELPMAVVRAAGPGDKSETIRRAADIDFAAFGDAYLRAVAGYRRDGRATIDKLPSNFLYIGMLRLGLPGARVIHLRRHPVDTAYAIYKTLFRMGYPYSYDLKDLASYFGAYHRLMEHWREAAPGFVIDVAYEELVSAPEDTLRLLLGRLDLSWEPACLEHQSRHGPVATASAAQVREPVHARSVGLWRHQAEGLAPFIDALQEQGILVESDAQTTRA
ncbi:MAG TPA: sulfotransferase [Caulobacteraceae bacterium]